MTQPSLAEHQAAVAHCPADSKVFLEGPAGAGKTTAGVARVLHLLHEGVPADAILVIVPQRTLATPYPDALRTPRTPAGGAVTVVTMGGLAQRMAELFWPLAAAGAGFADPDRPPTFLTLETAQYYMARLVDPLLNAGYFESIVINRNRLYSQILDNLNKAALVGFPHTQIAARLKAAWAGESSQVRVYDEAQKCATRFREYCLAHNLLDFSLQFELFANHLWPLPACRAYLLGRYTHLIADNVEEDTPVAHDILAEWLTACRSALVIWDRDAGYRRFLAADPESAYRLAALCQVQASFTESYVTSPDITALGRELARVLGARMTSPPRPPLPQGEGGESAALAALRYQTDPPLRYHPEMLDWVAAEIAGLVHDQGVPPGEIAVLAPFLSGALRFSLANRLASLRIPVRSHRPSRALREEPATECLLTLAALCHPDWRQFPTRGDVAYALMQAIEGMDLVRAHLLAEIVYRTRDGAPVLLPFDEIEPEMQERITFVLGGRYEGLRSWVSAHTARQRRSGNPAGELDHFLSRLFGELLSQPGYGFHADYDAGEITANLIESVRKFRRVMIRKSIDSQDTTVEDKSLGQEYVEMVRDGVVAAQYIRSWARQPEDAVLLAPAYTFLMSNRPVDHQFWLDVGSSGWWERLNQPLTHPYVLSRRWSPDTKWTDAAEVAARKEALATLVMGLVYRCRQQIHLGLSELSEQGSEQRGPLLQAIQTVLRGTPDKVTG